MHAMATQQYLDGQQIFWLRHEIRETRQRLDMVNQEIGNNSKTIDLLKKMHNSGRGEPSAAPPPTPDTSPIIPAQQRSEPEGRSG